MVVTNILFCVYNYHFREDRAPASSKTDSDTLLLVVDVDNKKEDDFTARSSFEYLVRDPSGRRQFNYVPSQRPTAPTSRSEAVFLKYSTNPRSEDDNFYVGDQPAKIIGSNDEVIYGFVVVFM